MLLATEKPTRTARATTAMVQVCLQPQVAQQLEAIMASIGWQVSAFPFDAYLSPERRPSIAPQLRAAHLRLAFVDFDADPEAAVVSTRHLKQIFQGDITVIALGSKTKRTSTNELLLLAMRAGCTEFLEKPLTEDSVLETLYRLESTLAPPAQPDRARGSLLAFFGVKGGVGTTTAAVHLATYLVQRHGKKVLLIDNHAALGHVCVYLGLDGTKFCFDEVVRNVSRLDSELLRGYIARHRSGLDVLSSPDICGALSFNEPLAITQTLEFLRGEYDFVLIDSPIAIDDVSLAIVNAASQVYLVTTPEVGSLRDLTRYLDQFQHSQPATNNMDRNADSKLRVVLNRHSANATISPEQIESAINRPVAIKLPSSGHELVRTENLGQVLAPEGKGDYVASLLQWSDDLAGATAASSASKARKSFFAGWK